jgi:hypothetical protein
MASQLQRGEQTLKQKLMQTEEDEERAAAEKEPRTAGVPPHGFEALRKRPVVKPEVGGCKPGLAQGVLRVFRGFAREARSEQLHHLCQGGYYIFAKMLFLANTFLLTKNKICLL